MGLGRASFIVHPVAADRDDQPGGSAAEGLVRQWPGDGVTGNAFASAAAAPLVRLEDRALEHGTTGPESLAGHGEAGLAELVGAIWTSAGYRGWRAVGWSADRRLVLRPARRSVGTRRREPTSPDLASV